MIIGVPKEILEGEKRVAIAPETVQKLKKLGIEVAVEKGAGEGSMFPDDEYLASGAQIEASHESLLGSFDIIIKINPPTIREADCFKKDSILISHIFAHSNQELVKKLQEKQVTTFALELIPRISRAQSMDVLSSMSSLAGYKAVLIAANHLRKIYPMMMTAAGTILPAKVFIIGAGVAGLQAIATAKRLGATVEAYDVRPVVKEQIESLGAKFVVLPLETKGAEGTGGYARAQSEEFYKKQQELLGEAMKSSDVLISTALVPGKKAPVLITEGAVKKLKPGSVIVDLAAEQGGNCELTEPGKEVVKHGVLISGLKNLPSLLSTNASLLFSRNIHSFLSLLCPKGALNIDLKDEIIKSSLLTSKGEIVSAQQTAHSPAGNK